MLDPDAFRGMSSKVCNHALLDNFREWKFDVDLLIQFTSFHVQIKCSEQSLNNGDG